MSNSRKIRACCTLLLVACLYCLSMNWLGSYCENPPLPPAKAESPNTDNPDNEEVFAFSVLGPEGGTEKKFSYAVSGINPDPSMVSIRVNGRPPDRLWIYMGESAARTPAVPSTFEAVVSGSVIESVGIGPHDIPADGFVIQGQGLAGQWVRNILRPGQIAKLDSQNQNLLVEMTPLAYAKDIESILNRIEPLSDLAKEPAQANNTGASNSPDLTQVLEKAHQCDAVLQQQGTNPLTKEILDTYSNCQKVADKAFYLSRPVNADEFRGIWVRPEEQTPQDIAAMLDKYHHLKIDHLFLETYYQGRTLYPSHVMEEYGLPAQHNQFVGQDPLKTWIELAHQRGMKVYAWFQTFMAGNSRESDEVYGPILQKYPQWSNVQRSAVNITHPVPSAIEPGHYFLDPANPEVRTFLQRLLEELVSQYDLDGINLDYIRYPASAGVNTSTYLSSNWGYTPVARSLFKESLKPEWDKEMAIRREAAEKELQQQLRQKCHTVHRFGKRRKICPKPENLAVHVPEIPIDPVSLHPGDRYWSRWMQWREDQVSSFVKAAHDNLKAQHPNLMLSAVVFPYHPENPVKLQDWPRWVEAGWVDALTPIGLGPDPEKLYEDSLRFNEVTQGKIPVYPGIFGMYNRYPTVDFLTQIDVLHKAHMPGVVLFENSRLTNEYEEALLYGPFRE